MIISFIKIALVRPVFQKILPRSCWLETLEASLRPVDVVGGGEAEAELGLASIVADWNADRLKWQKDEN